MGATLILLLFSGQGFGTSSELITVTTSTPQDAVTKSAAGDTMTKAGGRG